MLLPALGKAKEKAITIYCVNNLHQMGLAMHNVRRRLQRPPPGFRHAHCHAGPRRMVRDPDAVDGGAAERLPKHQCPALPGVKLQIPPVGLQLLPGFARLFHSPRRACQRHLRAINTPSSYILCGDCNYPSDPVNADLNNNDVDTLFNPDQFPVAHPQPPPQHSLRRLACQNQQEFRPQRNDLLRQQHGHFLRGRLSAIRFPRLRPGPDISYLAPFWLGSTGDPPVPVGDSPTGTECDGLES